MKIVLGSNSPRRKEVLEELKLSFKTITNNFDERLIEYKSSPEDYVKELSKAKAESLEPLVSADTLLLCGDTIVFSKGKIYPKPSDLDEAFGFLKHLSGSSHEVYSGLCLAHQNKYYIAFDKTTVTFRDLSDSMIKTYFNLIEPLDKAGGYAIQGAGSLIVSKIDGCYFNVMGMPMNALIEVFEKSGYNLWDLVDKV